MRAASQPVNQGERLRPCPAQCSDGARAVLDGLQKAAHYYWGISSASGGSGGAAAGHGAPTRAAMMACSTTCQAGTLPAVGITRVHFSALAIFSGPTFGPSIRPNFGIRARTESARAEGARCP